MSKYGWTKGSGLGADESGIVNPLRVQVEKRKKKSDAEGGGWAEPGNRAKVIGGKRKDEIDGGGGGGKFGGPMSEVIVLQRMLDNMEDLQGEIANGLGQEIGEECGEKVRLSSFPKETPALFAYSRMENVFVVFQILTRSSCSTVESSDYTSTLRRDRSLSGLQTRSLPFV